MTMRNLPPCEWRSFLERFSRAHRASLATVHGIERGVPVTCVSSVAIASVALETRDPGDVLRLTFANGVSLCAPKPFAVRVQEGIDGAEWALEVDTAAGAFIRTAFHTPATRPHTDGIAPGPVTVDVVSAAHGVLVGTG